MKQITRIHVAAALTLAFGLAGCGGTTQSTSNADPTTPAPEAANPAVDAAEDTAGTQAAGETEEETVEQTEAQTDEETEEQTEEAAEPADSAAGQADGAGTREDPLGAGEEFQVGDYTVVINEIQLDAADAVMEENQFNEPPAEGRQFVLVNLDAVYEGDETGNAFWDLAWMVLGSGGNTYGGGGAMEDSCGTIPSDLIEGGEQFPDSTVTGNICVSVPTDQLDGAQLIIEPLLSLDGERVFVALD